MALLLLHLSAPALFVGSAPACHRHTRTRAVQLVTGSMFKYQEVPAGKASALLNSYKVRIEKIQAKGFAPNVEAWLPPRQPQVKQMGEHILSIAAMCDATATCAAPLGADDAVGTDPAAERIARTRVTTALSATGASAVALVSYWPDHASVDAVVCNPAQLAAGESAEKRVLQQLVEAAQARGCADVRLEYSEERFFQLGANEFYERCAFYPADGEDDGAAATPRTFCHRV